jgi:uncharacterized membrane protein
MSHTFAPFSDLEGIDPAPSSPANVATAERVGSAVVGTALTAYGIARRDIGGALLGLLGGLLIYRGTTGNCAAYRQLGIDTAGRTTGRGVTGNAGIRIEQTVEVGRSPMELYHFWHQLANLPDIMPHVKSVVVDGAHSHWVVSGPAGYDVEWDAEFTAEKPGELIAWQSLPGAEVANAGSIHFEPTQNGFATRMKVSIEYLPPGGKAGALVARLLGQAPERQIENDLSRFKEKMETA